METMKKIIERKSNRFVSCFRPVDTDRVKGGSGKKAVDENQDVLAVDDINMEDTMMASLTFDDKVKVSDDIFVVKRSKRNKFSKIVKAVLFETSLAKKIRAKKLRKNPFRSSSNSSTNSEKSSIINQKSAPYTSSSDEDNYSENMTSTGSSSLTPTSILADDKMVISSGDERNQECWNYVLGLIFISLLVLVFWGKICAIFCTSSWLFFVPNRSRVYGSSGILVGLPEFDSLEYKKRVIMEGFLGRNHTKVL